MAEPFRWHRGPPFRLAPMRVGDGVLVAIDHVQLALPAGCEAQARAFYAGLLGLAEVAKPAALAARGGVWFEAPGLRLHLGVEEPFRPARKAHPAFRVAGLGTLRTRLEAAGIVIEDDNALPGELRFYAADPFGNRLEFMAVRSSDVTAGSAS
jgi:catechol 2,3-dioxygenase-like lactoylglutathione lyase family enzyme